jgi:hypothetical protein
VDCPKCKGQLPDNALFCAQCGQPQTSAAKSLIRSKTPDWAIVLAFLSLALFTYFVFHLVNDSKKEDAVAIKPRAGAVRPVSQPDFPPQPPPPQPHSLPIGAGALTVNASAYSWYQVFVPPGVTAVSITGHFTATGGTGNDIIVYVLDEDGFVNFKNGHPASTFYNSGKVTTASIGAVLPNAPTSYYLMLDNRFSLLTPKAVQMSATLNYMQ